MITLLKIAKSLSLSLLMSGFLLLTYTAEVQAKKPKITPAAEILPPGGKTIGGPAYWDGKRNFFDTYLIYSGPFSAICITIVNVGSKVVQMAPIQGAGDLVFPNETQTRCNENTDNFRVWCETGTDDCKAYWRIDSM